MSFRRDTFITLTGRILTLLLGMGFASASSWLLGPEGRGEFAFYIVLGTFMALIPSLGVEMAGAYFAGTKQYKLTEVVNAQLFIIIATSLISGISAFILWWLQPSFLEKISKSGLIILVIYIPLMLTNTCFWFLNSALGHSLIYSIGNVLWMSIRLVGILVLCWKSHKPEFALVACLFALLITTVYYYIILNNKYKIFNPLFSFGCVKDLYEYGCRYFFARFAQFLNMQIGTLIIAFLGTKQEIGFFATSMALVANMTVLSEIIGAVLLSRVVANQEKSLFLSAKAVRTVFWVVLFAGLLLVLILKPFIRIVFSAKFLPVYVPVLYLLPGMMIRTCSKTLGVYINGIGKPGVNSIAIICAVLTNILLMSILLPIYGVTGAAVAASIGYFVDALVLLLFFKYLLKHPLSLLLPKFSDVQNLYVIFREFILSIREDV